MGGFLDQLVFLFNNKHICIQQKSEFPRASNSF